EELNVSELAAAADMSPSAASQQLRVLRLAKFVEPRRVGRSIYYRLHDHHVPVLLAELANHAEHVRHDAGVREPTADTAAAGEPSAGALAAVEAGSRSRSS
ncbi:MAG: metalloregulator ArsR/SmtB family transcription factor, partial [Solirubrobacterales bacterium]